jgi:hypothetical protein
MARDPSVRTYFRNYLEPLRHWWFWVLLVVVMIAGEAFGWFDAISRATGGFLFPR